MAFKLQHHPRFSVSAVAVLRCPEDGLWIITMLYFWTNPFKPHTPEGQTGHLWATWHACNIMASSHRRQCLQAKMCWDDLLHLIKVCVHVARCGKPSCILSVDRSACPEACVPVEAHHISSPVSLPPPSHHVCYFTNVWSPYIRLSAAWNTVQEER